jgi:hypothetical protein
LSGISADMIWSISFASRILWSECKVIKMCK